MSFVERIHLLQVSWDRQTDIVSLLCMHAEGNNNAECTVNHVITSTGSSLCAYHALLYTGIHGRVALDRAKSLVPSTAASVGREEFFLVLGQ